MEHILVSTRWCYGIWRTTKAGIDCASKQAGAAETEKKEVASEPKEMHGGQEADKGNEKSVLADIDNSEFVLNCL